MTIQRSVRIQFFLPESFKYLYQQVRSCPFGAAVICKAWVGDFFLKRVSCLHRGFVRFKNSSLSWIFQPEILVMFHYYSVESCGLSICLETETKSRKEWNRRWRKGRTICAKSERSGRRVPICTNWCLQAKTRRPGFHRCLVFVRGLMLSKT